MHVVLAERFADQRIPPWADEGIAIRAESPAKQQRRLDELRQVAKTGAVYRASELFAVNRPPAEKRRAAFYGQSMVLVDLLLERGTPSQLLDFVVAAHRGHVKDAIQTVYGFESWDKFEIALGDRAVSRPVSSSTAPINAAEPARREFVSSR